MRFLRRHAEAFAFSKLPTGGDSIQDAAVNVPACPEGATLDDVDLADKLVTLEPWEKTNIATEDDAATHATLLWRDADSGDVDKAGDHRKRERWPRMTEE